MPLKTPKPPWGWRMTIEQASFSIGATAAMAIFAGMQTLASFYLYYGELREYLQYAGWLEIGVGFLVMGLYNLEVKSSSQAQKTC
jgi:hypothetical protein